SGRAADVSAARRRHRHRAGRELRRPAHRQPRARSHGAGDRLLRGRAAIGPRRSGPPACRSEGHDHRAGSARRLGAPPVRQADGAAAGRYRDVDRRADARAARRMARRGDRAVSVADVAAVLGRYDDETWIALANRGLLRRARKDLETLEVRVTSETHDGVEVAVGDRTVRIGVAGPGGAVCSCPSAVICQHIITAGLWLASVMPEPADQPGAAPAADRLHDDLMAIDAATLTSYAGLPGYRWAYQMIGDQATPPGVARD